MVVIKQFDINNFKKPFIIAEIGANHNGDINLAKKLIDIAHNKGASCVKFQSWTKDSIFSRMVYDQNYFLSDDYRDRTDYTLESIVDAYHLGKQQLSLLKNYCDEIGIIFGCTPFSNEEVDFLVNELDVDFIKIASMDLSNLPFLEYIAKKEKPVMISTGLHHLSEIDEAVRLFRRNNNEKIILLHCVSIYPPNDNDLNLNNIDTLRNLYNVPIGFSDHTIGVTASILSIAKGACVIEKHFTLDNNMEGWDHAISADPCELEKIIKESNRAYKMLGNKYPKRLESTERLNAFKRSVVASRDIDKGQVINREDLLLKRPGSGISPKNIKFIIGKRAKKKISRDELIKMEDF